MATQIDSKVKFLEVKVVNGALKFAFGNGQSITLNPAHCSDTIREAAMFHGFNQKMRDSTAGFSKDNDYEGAMAAMGEVADSLLANEWNRRGKGETSISQLQQDLASAIATLRKAPIEKATAAVEAATPEQRKAWGKNAQIAAIMADLKAQRAMQAAATATDDNSIDSINLD